jgi:hypothetical protein
MADSLGPNEAIRRMYAAYDTVVRTREARAALDRVDMAAVGRHFEIRGGYCDSLKAITNRDVGPIRSAPDSLRER